MPPGYAIILLAHGSRDPLWCQAIEAVARRMLDLMPGTPVLCAYMELAQPDLQTGAAMLVAEGATHIRIVPMFLGLGKHARDDLPVLARQLQRQHPKLEVDLRPAVGENHVLVDLMARIALAD